MAFNVMGCALQMFASLWNFVLDSRIPNILRRSGFACGWYDACASLWCNMKEARRCFG